MTKILISTCKVQTSAPDVQETLDFTDFAQLYACLYRKVNVF